MNDTKCDALSIDLVEKLEMCEVVDVSMCRNDSSCSFSSKKEQRKRKKRKKRKKKWKNVEKMWRERQLAAVCRGPYRRRSFCSLELAWLHTDEGYLVGHVYLKSLLLKVAVISFSVC